MECANEESSTPSSGRSSDWDKKLFRTLFLVNLAGILERADEALLPGVYREIGLSLHASPTRLGSLTLLRSVVQILCFPLAAYMSVHHNRAGVIALGAMLWAVATFFVGASSTFAEVAISGALNGIGLAMVIPAIQSLVADAADPQKRGLAFGWLQFTGNLGGVFGNVFSVLLAGTTVFGLAGWRASFHIIAAASVVVAFLVYQFAFDPRFKEGPNPIFAEIVPEKLRTSIYALDRSFESLLASFAPPLVGILAEHVFGYVSAAPHASEDASSVADTRNAVALGKALYVAFGIPYTCCCLLYSVLYWTYPKDRDKAQLEAEQHLNREGSAGITEFYDLKPDDVSLGKESDAVGVQMEKSRDRDKLKLEAELHLNREGSAGITEFYDLKPDDVSLGKESDALGVQMEKSRDRDKLKLEAELHLN